MQVEAELLPLGKDNPWGNAFVKKETELVDESTSGRVVDCLKARFWKIKNPSVHHEFSGKPRSRLAEHRNSAVLFSVSPLRVCMC
jgi:primary-amine oxidase